MSEPRRPSEDREGLDWTMRGLIAIAFGIAILGGVLLCFLNPGFVVVLVLAIATVISGVYLFLRWQSARREALTWALAIAAERGTPLRAVFEMFAMGRVDWSRWDLMNVAGMLDVGVPLPEALAARPGIVSRNAEILIRMGSECGTLPGAFRDVAALDASRRSQFAALLSRVAYLTFVLVVVEGISSFVLYFIIPKFEAIAMDFGAPLPAVTQWVIRGSHFLIGPFGPILALMVLAEVVLLVLVGLAMVGQLRFDVPAFDATVMRRRHSATVLRSLAMVVEGGRPLPWGIAQLVRHYPSSWVRGRLDLVLHEIDGGADEWSALQRRGLIGKADEALLEAARRVGNLAWAMRQAAEAGERRSSYRFQATVQVLNTLAVIGMGGVVLVLATAYFTPLIVIMERLVPRY